MFDVVIPDGNEDTFIAMALELGYDEIAFLTQDIRYKRPASDRMIVKSAYLIKDQSEISRARKSFDYIFAPAERKFFECRPDYIMNSELSDRRDSFHYRNTSLNQVHAKLAKDNHTNIVFNFSLLLGRKRIVYLGRMMQNAAIVRKYSLGCTSFSLAQEPYEMRSRTMLDALLHVLGL